MTNLKTFAIILLLNLNCNTTSKVNQVKEYVVNATIDDFGKFKPSQSIIKITKIKQKDLTSALYVFINNDKTISTIPVNDKLFNYDYFDEKIYPSLKGKKVKLHVAKYIINKKEILIANQIE